MSNIKLRDDKDAIIYNEGIIEGTKHSKPSPDTVKSQKIMTEKINNLEQLMSEFKTHLDYIREELKQNKDEHKEIKLIIKDFIRSADNKYANKLVEKVVYGLVGVVLVAVITSIITLVLK